MKYKLVALLLVMLSKNVIAQNAALKVTVNNDKGENILNATAQILKSSDSSLLFVKVLKPNTFFSLPKNGTYILRVSAVNINQTYKSISIGDIDTTIINIIASTKSKNLDAVVVTATKKAFIQQDDDKTIIDAEPLAQSSSNAYEIVEKTPSVIVDQDGNVYLNSATPATIFINGKQIQLGAAEIANLLKNLPASSIAKIEILRNPSAKYDAASSGGILNIVLKNGAKIGLNGSVDASYFQGIYSTKTLGFTITKNDGKLNKYLSYNITNRIATDRLFSERPTDAGVLFIQSFFYKLPIVNNFISGGLSYDVNKKTSIAYDAKITINNNRSNVANDIDVFRIIDGAKIGENSAFAKNAGPSYFINNTFTVTHKIDSLGSEWTNSLDYTFFDTRNTQNYTNINILPAKNNLIGNGVIDNTKNIIAFKSDAVFKLKKAITLEIGTKINANFSKNNAAYFSDTSTGKYVDRLQTNGFKYTEKIAALYVQASKTFKGFTIKPGLRYEYTNLDGNQIIPSDTTFKIRLNNVFPYVFVRRSLGKAFGFKIVGNAIFRRSITRPFYEALNPFPKYFDQYTYDVGNPALQPQFINNYEINFTANDIPVLSAGLNDIKDIFTTITYAKGDTLFRTYDNLGTNKEIYARVVVGIPPGKKYFAYVGVQINAINYKGVYDVTPFKYKKTYVNIFMAQNLKATPTLTLNANGFLRFNQVVNFFELKTYGTLNLSANKAILKKKMNVILSVNDVFRTNVVRFVINQPGFTAIGNRYNDTQRVGLALRYNFGLKPRPERRAGFELPPTYSN